ncbi:MAG: hypothetical protein ACYC35_12935 [Pirellulales bacterium]
MAKKKPTVKKPAPVVPPSQEDSQFAFLLGELAAQSWHALWGLKGLFYDRRFRKYPGGGAAFERDAAKWNAGLYAYQQEITAQYRPVETRADLARHARAVAKLLGPIADWQDTCASPPYPLYGGNLATRYRPGPILRALWALARKLPGKTPPAFPGTVTLGTAIDALGTLEAWAEQSEGKGGAGKTPSEPRTPKPADKTPKRGRPTEKATIRRADFAKPLREQKWTWEQISAEYEAKHPRDTDASPDVLRKAFERQYPKPKRRKAGRE